VVSVARNVFRADETLTDLMDEVDGVAATYIVIDKIWK